MSLYPCLVISWHLNFNPILDTITLSQHERLGFQTFIISVLFITSLYRSRYSQCLQFASFGFLVVVVVLVPYRAQTKTKKTRCEKHSSKLPSSHEEMRHFKRFPRRYQWLTYLPKYGICTNVYTGNLDLFFKKNSKGRPSL